MSTTDRKLKPRLRRTEKALFAAPLILIAFYGWGIGREAYYRYSGELRHSSLVEAVAFAPNGTLAVSACGDYQDHLSLGRIHLWDIATRTEKQASDVPELERIDPLAFSKEGKLLAFGSSGHILNLWDMTGRHLRWTASGYLHGVTSASFSSDSTRLASGSMDGMVKVWNVATGKLLWAAGPLWPGKNPDQETYVAFAPNASVLASIGADNKLRLYDGTTGALQQSLPTAPAGTKPTWCLSLAFAPDGSSLATACESSLQVWNTRPCKKRWQSPGRFYAVAISPDGTTVATMNFERSVQLWATADGKLLKTYPANVPDRAGIFWLSSESSMGWMSSSAVAFSPDGRTLAYIDKRSVRLKNLAP